MMEVRVSQDGMEERGFCSSMHLVPTRTNQLTRALEARLAGGQG